MTDKHLHDEVVTPMKQAKPAPVGGKSVNKPKYNFDPILRAMRIARQD